MAAHHRTTRIQLSPEAKKPKLEERALRYSHLRKILECYDIIEEIVGRGPHQRRRLVRQQDKVVYSVHWIRRDSEEVARDIVSKIRWRFGLVPPRVSCANFYARG